jgi:hypothetical protein
MADWRQVGAEEQACLIEQRNIFEGNRHVSWFDWRACFFVPTCRQTAIARRLRQ